MTPGPELRTARLLLRRWRPEDQAPFAAMNADDVVMQFFASTLTSLESAAVLEQIEAGFELHGYGLWAAEMPGTARFIGFVGLSPVRPELPLAPGVEVGWRLGRPFWGQGLATEAARAALAFGFRELELEEVVSFTAEGNLRSRRVMERLGMHPDPSGAFDHPGLPDDHPHRRHVLYRIEPGAVG